VSYDLPIHVLLRFSDMLVPGGGTIASHQKVLSKEGGVWFGKAGKPLAHRHIQQINSQCKDHIASFLYLVQRVAGQYELYKGTVLTMSRSLPEGEQQFVPSYYKELYLLHDVRYWTKLSKLTKAPPQELEKLVLVNSGMPARLSLMQSMAGLFLVRRYNSI
jgi:hypothetical protein